MVIKGHFEWRVFAEVTGMAGVIATLVFVAMEIRQNTAAVKSAAIQAIAAQS